MFGIGFGEMLVIMVVALLVFGPDRLPVMAKQAASFVRDLRLMVAKARSDLSDSVGDLGIDTEDLRTLADLRNPQSFVRSNVLNGVDLDELKDEFTGDPLDSDSPRQRTTGRPNGTKAPSQASQQTATTPPPFDPDAT